MQTLCKKHSLSCVASSRVEILKCSIIWEISNYVINSWNSSDSWPIFFYLTDNCHDTCDIQGMRGEFIIKYLNAYQKQYWVDVFKLILQHFHLFIIFRNNLSLLMKQLRKPNNSLWWHLSSLWPNKIQAGKVMTMNFF